MGQDPISEFSHAELLDLIYIRVGGIMMQNKMLAIIVITVAGVLGGGIMTFVIGLLTSPRPAIARVKDRSVQSVLHCPVQRTFLDAIRIVKRHLECAVTNRIGPFTISIIILTISFHFAGVPLAGSIHVSSPVLHRNSPAATNPYVTT